jgi:hypothetical protein
MIGLLKDLAALAMAVPELVPLFRTLVKLIGGAGTKEEKLTRARRAVIAASGRQALFEALPGTR